MPDIVKFPLLIITGKVGPQILFKWNWYSKPLYLDERQEKPAWFIHPKYKTEVDVIALHLSEKEEPILDNMSINTVEFDDYGLHVADDVFVLGFPYKLNGGGRLPLWKRGTIACEPGADIDGLPKVLIDTASRKGMSGAPVIMRRIGIHGAQEGKPPELIGQIQSFLGVYSGRIKSSNDRDDLEAQLGIVWKASVISEIIEGGILDTKDSFCTNSSQP